MLLSARSWSASDPRRKRDRATGRQTAREPASQRDREPGTHRGSESRRDTVDAGALRTGWRLGRWAAGRRWTPAAAAAQRRWTTAG